MAIIALLALVAFITGNRIIWLLLLGWLFWILTYNERKEKRIDKIIKEWDAIVERCMKKNAANSK